MFTSKNRFRRSLAALTATVAAALTLGLAGVSPAGATTGVWGGSATTTLSCGSAGLYHDVLITPQTGFSYNQLVGYEMYVQDLTAGTAGWTPWTYFYASQRIQGYQYPATNHNYRIYMYYGWRDANGRWTYAGEWINTYIHRTGGTPVSTPYCYEW